MNNKVIVCAGSGGVGKTTIAAAMAVRASLLGKRVLVLTVDPAKRLATALGLDLQDHHDKKVPLEKGELSAAVIDSKKIFDEFIATHAQGAEIVAKIMKNRLYQQLSTTLAGSQEFTSLERLLQATESGKYDLVVLDTPPTKHAVDFLTAPQRINSLFQEGVTKWFMGPGDKPSGLFARVINKGTRTVLKSLETLTGGQFIEELVDFFSAVRSIQSVLRTRSEDAHKVLLGEKTKFVVVTSFDAAKLMEAKYLQGELARLDYRLAGVVINRAFPVGLPEGLSPDPGSEDHEAQEKLISFFGRFKEYYGNRYRMYDEFARGLDKKVAVVRVPEYQRDVLGLADLEKLAEVIG